MWSSNENLSPIPMRENWIFHQGCKWQIRRRLRLRPVLAKQQMTTWAGGGGTGATCGFIYLPPGQLPLLPPGDIQISIPSVHLHYNGKMTFVPQLNIRQLYVLAKCKFELTGATLDFVLRTNEALCCNRLLFFIIIKNAFAVSQ